jgi:hypothetical protein
MDNNAYITSILILSNSQSMLIIYQMYFYGIDLVDVFKVWREKQTTRRDVIFFMKKQYSSYTAMIDGVSNKI